MVFPPTPGEIFVDHTREREKEFSNQYVEYFFKEQIWRFYPLIRLDNKIQPALQEANTLNFIGKVLCYSSCLCCSFFQCSTVYCIYFMAPAIATGLLVLQLYGQIPGLFMDWSILVLNNVASWFGIKLCLPFVFPGRRFQKS